MPGRYFNELLSQVGIYREVEEICWHMKGLTYELVWHLSG